MLWLLPILTAAALFQSTALPGLTGVGLRPDLAVVVVIGWATLRGWEEGLVAGLLGGLIGDSLSAAPFGIQMVRLGLLGLAAGFVMAGLARTSALFPIVAATAGSVLSFFVALVGLQAAGWMVAWERSLLFEAVPNALLTGACMALALPLIRALIRRTTANTEGTAR